MHFRMIRESVGERLVGRAEWRSMAAPRGFLSEVACCLSKGWRFLFKQTGEECAQRHVSYVCSGLVVASSVRLLVVSMQS